MQVAQFNNPDTHERFLILPLPVHGNHTIRLQNNNNKIIIIIIVSIT